jgi:hypothetical protein
LKLPTAKGIEANPCHWRQAARAQALTEIEGKKKSDEELSEFRFICLGKSDSLFCANYERRQQTGKSRNDARLPDRTTGDAVMKDHSSP